MGDTLRIKPYARLITMLGEQLIKDGTVALSELIKNSYDADASCVFVSFENFSNDGKSTKNSRIIISDDGCGMTEDVIKDSWINPATPYKYNLVREGHSQTLKGRIIQGEKGIGRFAVFKLGKTVELVTSPQKKENGLAIDTAEGHQYTVKYDFSGYGDAFTDTNGRNMYLDELAVDFSSSLLLSNSFPNKKPYGTRIIISNLNSEWDKGDINNVQQVTSRMLPIFEGTDDNGTSSFTSNSNLKNSFSIVFFLNGNILDDKNDSKKRLLYLINSEKPAIKITNGHFDDKRMQFIFKCNGAPTILNVLTSSEIARFKETKEFVKRKHVCCGPFDFEFYIFDPTATVDDEPKHYLEKSDYQLVKSHRIYLYRDGVRVMPYGDPKDDWIGIDMLRGTEKASSFMSNDQTIGCIKITRANNPLLEDKTSREGLIENGSAMEEFRNSILLLLRWVRAYPYMSYTQTKECIKEENRLAFETTIKVIDDAKQKFKDNKEVLPMLDRIGKSYLSDKQEYNRRLEITSRLAGVGMSIETTSHDVMIFLNRAEDGVYSMISGLNSSTPYSKEELLNRLTSISGDLSFAKRQMNNIGILYPGTRTKPKQINVWAIIEKIKEIYAYQYNKNEITCSNEQPSEPLIVTCVDAVLLQSFINLFDNSLYWLNTCSIANRKVIVSYNIKDRIVIFSDNGPGISKDDYGFLFKPFFSRKGDEGKGLGLYIAKQLLSRYGFTIDLITEDCDKLLSGANFRISFGKVD